MNLMEENFVSNEEKKKKRTSTIILVAIFIVLIAIISIIVYLAYVNSGKLKVYIDGKQNKDVLGMVLIKEDGSINFPIKELRKLS